MLALRAAVCQSRNLGSAYARYRRYRGLWANRSPMYCIAEAPVEPMLRLAEDLRSGRYRPSPPHRVAIAKADGERRELFVYMLRDRVAQRALLQVLQPLTEPAMAPFSFAYRPRRSAAAAVAAVRTLLDTGLSWIVDADIRHCFDAIPRQPLLDEVTRRLDSPEAASLVAQCLGWDTQHAREERGIPQGSVLGPWLCNVYLWQLDDAMSAAHVKMVRFADDFVLLNLSRAAAESVKANCAAMLAGLRLQLHPVKTQIRDATRPFRFLGQWLRTTPLLQDASATPGAHARCC